MERRAYCMDTGALIARSAITSVGASNLIVSVRPSVRPEDNSFLRMGYVGRQWEWHAFTTSVIFTYL